MPDAVTLTYRIQASVGRALAGEGAEYTTLAEARKQMASILATQAGPQGRRIEYDDEGCVMIYDGRQFVDRLWIEDSGGCQAMLGR